MVEALAWSSFHPGGMGQHDRLSRAFQFQRSANRSTYRGVHEHGKHGFRAVIFQNGRQTHLGTFPSLELACEAYSIAAAQRDTARLARVKADAESQARDLAKRRAVEEALHTASAQEIAQYVVSLIRDTIACSRDQIDQDARHRLELAAEMISGISSFGKGSQAATNTNADVATDAAEVQLRREVSAHAARPPRTAAVR
jgi:hypothetical protein